MPSIDVSGGPMEESAGQGHGPPSGAVQPIVGIIYPPPEVRNIVDKTASFVARNGPEFESRIRQNELNNPKFNFLNTGDPYNAYYQHKVKDLREGKGGEAAVQAAVGGAVPTAAKTITSATQQKQQQILKRMDQVFVPKDPPPDFEFTADPPSISALDLDIVRLTAQFVARNGRQFLTNLMNREQRNYQFDFLRPQHSLFQYFTKLLEQYTKILIPPKDLMVKLREESSSSQKVLEQVKYRADWIRHQEAVKRKEEMALEKERVAYAQIDWHDFVVVETVDYTPGEIGNFPPPTTPDEVGARVLREERATVTEEKRDKEEKEDSDEVLESEEEEEEKEPADKAVVDKPSDDKPADDNRIQDMEEESSSSSSEDESDEEETSEPPIPGVKPTLPPPSAAREKKSLLPPLPPSADKVIIKKGYDPKAAAKAASKSDDFLISPINGERIPASKVQQHMKIGLLDPRWVEQRDKTIQDRINQENVYAPGSAIEANLKQLAERRTDIFGTGDEETAIGKKIGEEDKKKEDKVTWDGYTSSVEAATRAARANITIEEQIHQIHKVKGLLPDEEKEKIGPKPVPPGSAKPPAKQVPPPPPPTSSAPTLPPLPPSKPPQPPLPPSLPPPPGMMAPPQPPIMMVPAPMRAPLMVPTGFPVVQSGPPGFMGPPGTRPVPPPPPPQSSIPLPGIKPPAPPDDDEPPAKKIKTEESLVPESEFLSKNDSTVSFKIIVPNMAEKSDWRLNGQTVEITLPLRDSVSSVKAKLQEATGMPPAKQKLHQEGLFFKDSNSLAYYNITEGTTVCLGVKERGGRKK